MYHRTVLGSATKMRKTGVEVLVEVDHRDAEGPDGGGGEVEHPHARVAQLGPVGAMCAGGGGVEYELDVTEVRHRKQAVDTSCGGGHLHPSGARQSVGGRVDSYHRASGQGTVTAQNFDHQVGADVARTNNGRRPLLL